MTGINLFFLLVFFLMFSLMCPWAFYFLLCCNMPISFCLLLIFLLYRNPSVSKPFGGGGGGKEGGREGGREGERKHF